MTTRGSSTALLIAATLVFLAEGRKRVDLVDPEALAIGRWLFKNYSGRSRWIARMMRTTLFRLAVNRVEKWTVPGILEYFAFRKRVISQLADEAFDLGVGQLVILGAGYDALAVRSVRKREKIDAWEIDHPATQTWKRRAIEGAAMNSDRLHFVPMDFGEALPQLSAGFSRERPVFCVAEGLLMYLTEPQVIDLFRWLRRLTRGQCRIAFTFMEPQADGNIDFRHRSKGVHAWLSSQRETFKWGIHRAYVASFLEKQGFQQLPIAPEITQEADRRSVGEFLALAETIHE